MLVAKQLALPHNEQMKVFVLYARKAVWETVWESVLAADYTLSTLKKSAWRQTGIARKVILTAFVIACNMALTKNKFGLKDLVVWPHWWSDRSWEYWFKISSIFFTLYVVRDCIVEVIRQVTMHGSGMQNVRCMYINAYQCCIHRKVTCLQKDFTRI